MEGAPPATSGNRPHPIQVNLNEKECLYAYQ